jgi:hypothetical protein
LNCEREGTAAGKKNQVGEEGGRRRGEKTKEIKMIATI